jgi:PST family polysaccharide transporter
LSYLLNSVFNMPASALYVRRRNRDVLAYHIVHILLFAGASLVFVPAVGIVGYGIGELVALPSYLVLHRQLGKLIPYSYDRPLPWLIAFLPPLWAAALSFPWSLLLWTPSIVVLLWPPQRRQLGEYLGYLRAAASRSGRVGELAVVDARSAE